MRLDVHEPVPMSSEDYGGSSCPTRGTAYLVLIHQTCNTLQAQRSAS